MKFSRKILFVLLILAVTGGTAVAQEILVGGTVTLKKKPEIASFNLSIAGIAKTPDEAQAGMIKSITAVQAELKKLKLEFNTVGYRLQTNTVQKLDPITGRADYVIVGYTAETTYHVKIEDLAKLPKALNLTALPGVSKIWRLSFALRDPEAAEREARAAAVEDAMINAKAIMKAARKDDGKTDFEIVKIQQNSVMFTDPFGYLNLPEDSIKYDGQEIGRGGIGMGNGGGDFNDSIIIPGDLEVTASVVMSVKVK